MEIISRSITKEELMNPNSSIAKHLRFMNENILEAMATMRELKAVYDAMVKRVWEDEPITFEEVENTYCEKMDELASKVIHNLM